MKRIALFLFFLLMISSISSADEEPRLFWPPPPASMRVAFIKSIYSGEDGGAKKGFFKKIEEIVFGRKANILSKPISIAVDKRKTFYICDTGVSAVYIFSSDRKYFRKISEINEERFLSPVGIAVAEGEKAPHGAEGEKAPRKPEKGRVFIADSGLKKVFCVDGYGRFKFLIGAGMFLRPAGLAIFGEKLFVVDSARAFVFIFDLEGNFIGKFGGKGKGQGEFNYPAAIAVDKDGNIYVADTLNFRIQVFDRENKFLYDIGQIGDSSGYFSRPKAVAVDFFGHIYVTDGVFDNIQIFNRKKEFLLSLGEAGHKDGEFWIPAGIAVDSENYIYVADSYNRRIQIFRYVGED